MNDESQDQKEDEVEPETDGDEPIIDVDLESEDELHKDYPWTTDKDVMLRSFVFQTLADSDTSVFASVEHMDACYEWIKNKMLPASKKKKPDHIKAVES